MAGRTERLGRGPGGSCGLDTEPRSARGGHWGEAIAAPGSGDTLAPGSVCTGGTVSRFHQASPSKGARHQNPNTCTSSSREFIASCALNHTGPKPAQRGAGQFPGAERGCPAAPPRERLLPALLQLSVTSPVTFRKLRGAAAAHTALAPPCSHLPPRRTHHPHGQELPSRNPPPTSGVKEAG